MSYINVGICGKVSSGKTTAINSFMERYIGETKMKRTTMNVCSFINNKKSKLTYHYIKSDIENQNTTDDKKSQVYEFNFPSIENKDFQMILHDFPGFDDGNEQELGMENLFYNMLPKIDYILYIIDATCPLIHKSEKDLLISVFMKIKENHENSKYTRIIFCFNKFDDEDNEEVVEMINEAKKWINDNFKEEKWFYNVSFRKMMMRNVLKNKQQLEDIPISVVKQMLIDMYGRTKANKIIKSKSYDKIDASIIELFDDEKKLINIMNSFTEKDFHCSNIALKFREKLNNIKKIDQDLLNCITSHSELEQLDINLFIKMISDRVDIFETELMSIIDYENFIELSSKIIQVRMHILDEGYDCYLYPKYLKHNSNVSDILIAYIVSEFINVDIENWIEDVEKNQLLKYNYGRCVNTLCDKKCVYELENGRFEQKEYFTKDLLSIDIIQKVLTLNENSGKLIEVLDILICNNLFENLPIFEKEITECNNLLNDLPESFKKFDVKKFTNDCSNFYQATEFKKYLCSIENAFKKNIRDPKCYEGNLFQGFLSMIDDKRLNSKFASDLKNEIKKSERFYDAMKSKERTTQYKAITQIIQKKNNDATLNNGMDQTMVEMQYEITSLHNETQKRMLTHRYDLISPNELKSMMKIYNLTIQQFKNIQQNRFTEQLINQLKLNLTMMNNMNKKDFRDSNTYMHEKKLNTCSRMEYNYIFSNDDPGIRVYEYPDIQKYHELTNQLMSGWEKKVKLNDELLGILPSHIINRIMMSRINI